MRHVTIPALLAILASGPAAAGQMWLQFSATLGGEAEARRVYLYLDDDRIPGGPDRTTPEPTTSPASPGVVGVPLIQQGLHVPNVVYEAHNRETAGYPGDLRRLCQIRPLSCALSGLAFASSPLLDLGPYRKASADETRSHRLAP